MAVEYIKGHADSYDENDMYIRTGLYMALAIIKTRAEIGYGSYMDDENLENIFLERLGLDEEFELKFVDENGNKYDVLSNIEKFNFNAEEDSYF